MRGSPQTTSRLPAVPHGAPRSVWRTTLRSFVMGTLFACLASCARPPAASSDPASSIDGEWGGTKARVAATTDGATLEFPCANGRIEHPIHPDRDGRFDVEGTYTPLRGNAPSDDARVHAPATQTVRYIGRAHGDEMTISIRFGDAESETFVLKRGASATVPQCSEIRNPILNPILIPKTETTI